MDEVIHHRFAYLHQIFESENIPVEGLALLPDGSIRIDFIQEATREQRDRAQQIITDAPQIRRKKTRAALVTELTNLSNAARNQLMLYFVADWLLQRGGRGIPNAPEIFE